MSVQPAGIWERLLGVRGALVSGAKCEGWLLFEVPEGLAMESAEIRAQVSPARGGAPGTVRWQARQ